MGLCSSLFKLSSFFFLERKRGKRGWVGLGFLKGDLGGQGNNKWNDFSGQFSTGKCVKHDGQQKWPHNRRPNGHPATSVNRNAMTPPFDQVFGLSVLGTGPVLYDRPQWPPLPHWERILISPQTRHYVPVPVAHDRVSRFPGLGSRARSPPATVPHSLLPLFSPGRKGHPTRSLGWRGVNFSHCLKKMHCCVHFLLKLKLVVGYVFNWNHLCILSLVSNLWNLGCLGVWLLVWVCVFI